LSNSESDIPCVGACPGRVRIGLRDDPFGAGEKEAAAF
jgi:hypothetical protein